MHNMDPKHGPKICITWTQDVFRCHKVKNKWGKGQTEKKYRSGFFLY
jgi:hypothetical protein